MHSFIKKYIKFHIWDYNIWEYGIVNLRKSFLTYQSRQGKLPRMFTLDKIWFHFWMASPRHFYNFHWMFNSFPLRKQINAYNCIICGCFFTLTNCLHIKMGTIPLNVISDIRGHEQRALNFLVNEYLLSHSYRLTAITFSDENSAEDFEDWESIGLDTDKPPSLLRYDLEKNSMEVLVGGRHRCSIYFCCGLLKV